MTNRRIGDVSNELMRLLEKQLMGGEAIGMGGRPPRRPFTQREGGARSGNVISMEEWRAKHRPARR